ncbi:MAG: Eco57I restriction-modification methylase domain-containing protein [Oscillospiraceae bacterium]
MAEQSFFDRVSTHATHVPDVLSCIANLSNDEVFTPPEVVNRMLDLLPQELFADPNITFLDPATKTGVFLREIAKRCLEAQLPGYKERSLEISEKKSLNIPLDEYDIAFQKQLQERIDHIFHKQLYAIAITELTSLLARRSVYCSKYPNGPYSITHFDNAEGNIRFRRTEHVWQNGKCVFCGANQGQYDRDKSLETHAYEFIHFSKPEEIFNMKFDVIIGNPPYQLSDGGHGASAIPIYQKFISAAKKLSPRFITMITPSRWFTGGRGLDEFRKEMLQDKHLRVIHDFADASDCFTGVEIKGGVNYFLWDRDNEGLCHIYSHMHDGKTFSMERPLLEKGLDVFIRDSRSIAIIRKVQNATNNYFTDIVSANDPFGYDVRVENSYLRVKPDIKKQPFDGSLQIYYFGWRDKGVGYISSDTVRKGYDLVDKYKVYIPRAWGVGNPAKDRLNPFIGDKGSVCTETYSVVAASNDKEYCENVVSYIETKFFHFLVSLVKITQAAAKHVYKLVPLQDFSKPWTDEELYKKYNLTQEEIDFIESTIKPIDLGGDENG